MSTSAHPDVATLGELVEGSLSTGAAVVLRGHLAVCAGCTADTASLRDALDRVADLLAGLPAPTMPAEVAARLDAVLAAAPPFGSTDAVTPELDRPVVPPPGPVPAGAVGPPSASVTTLPSGGRRRPRGTILAAAAASVLVLAGSGVFLSTVGGTSDQPATSAPQATLARGLVLASGTDYDEAALDAAVPGLLRGESAGPAAERASGPEPLSAPADAGAPGPLPALTRLEDPTALQDCLSELSGTATTTPLVLDYAAYQGAPALVVVLAGLSPDRVDVFVVGPGCAPRQADLLLYRSVPR